MFSKGSRYENVENAIYTDENGMEINYNRIRFIKEKPAHIEHTVKQGERLDHIAFIYYRDPTKFWLICDANNVSEPHELEVPGKRILIPPDSI